MKTTPLSRTGWRGMALGTVVLMAANGCGFSPVAKVGGATELGGEQAASTNAPLVVPLEAATTNEAPAILRAERVLPPLRPELAEVVRLVDSGIGEEVVRAYVSTASHAYDLSLEEIVYLRDLGISDGILAAMMRRGGELRAEAAQLATQQADMDSAVERITAAMVAASQVAPEAGEEGMPTEGPAPVAMMEAPADAPAEVQQFYSHLAPYGSWYQVPTYGWVWQPSVVVVSSGWTPYRHGGRWLWTDAGWYWSSDYSWGWAPFHYGRWATHPGLGWCWVPGSVWGPSWVTWRHHGSFVGWAPLPPGCGWSSGIGLTWFGSGVSVGFGFGLSSSCFTFVPGHCFAFRNVGHYAVGGHQAHSVFQNSTVINNVIVGDNNTIINNGIGYNNVAALVRSEVPKARLENLPNQATRPLRADRLERGQDGYVIYKPTPVSGKPGQATALRPEVRPTSDLAQSTPGRLLSPSRTGPGTASRAVVNPGTMAGKQVETRGGMPAPGLSGTGTKPSTSMAGRPSLNTPQPVVRPGAPAVSGSGRTVAPVSGAKAVESRGMVNPARQVAPQSLPRANAPAGGSAVRQTLPVPLADPSRNIPAHLRQPAAVATPKSAVEARMYQAPTPPAAPANRSFQAVPRTMSAPSAPVPTVQRPSAPSFTPRPAVVPPRAPAPTFQAPSPAARPSISAPAPAFQAPQAPRPMVTAPSRAMQAPTAPTAPTTGPRAQPR